MSLKRWAFLPALLAFAAFGSARADYSYQSAISFNNSTFSTATSTVGPATNGLPAGISLTFIPNSETVVPTSIYGPTYMGIFATATNATPVDFTGVNYAFRVTITNISGTPANQVGDFYIYGTISGQQVSGNGTTGSGVINNTYSLVTATQFTPGSFPAPGGVLSAARVIGGTTFTFSENSPAGDYAKATVNPNPSPGSGGFSGTISPTNAIPEPASVVMLGLGLCGLGLVGLRKRQARA